MPLVGSEPLRREMLPAVLCFQSLISFLYLLDVSDIVYFPTIHRKTYTLAFDLGFNPYPALLVASGFWTIYLLSRGWRKEALLCLIPYLFSSFSLEGSVAMNVMACSAMAIYKYGYRGEAVKWVLRILTGFYTLALVHWLILYPLGLNSGLVFIADLEIKLYHLGTYLAPLLVVALLSVWILKPITEKMLGKPVAVEVGEVKFEGRNLLILSVMVGVFSAIYPYFPAVNPDGYFIGVDATKYQAVLESIQDNILDIFSVFGGGRPFFFLVLRLFQIFTFSGSEQAVKFFPVILVPALGVSTYYFAEKLSGDPAVAGWAAFFSVTGVKTVVGFYSYFLSNLLGLVLIQFSLGLLFDAMETGSRARLAASSLLAALCLYTHPWTFDQYIITLLALTGLLIVYKRRGGEPDIDFRSLVAFLLFQVFAEASKMLLFKGVSGTDALTKIVLGNLMFDRFWHSAIFGFRLLYGGYMSHIVLILLALVGAYSLKNKKNGERYLTVFLALTFMGFFIAYENVMIRLFYNLPLECYAALGYVELVSKQRNQKGLIGFLIIYSLVYLLRSLANTII